MLFSPLQDKGVNKSLEIVNIYKLVVQVYNLNSMSYSSLNYGRQNEIIEKKRCIIKISKCLFLICSLNKFCKQCDSKQKLY